MSASRGLAESTTVQRRSKDKSIQALRGLAVILMVAAHTIGSRHRGLDLPDHSWWRYYYRGLEDIRMPLFTVISGYVYALRPGLVPSAYLAMVKGKAQRLLWPLLTVGTLFFVVKLFVKDSNSVPKPGDFWRVYLFGFDHLWFLQAIFLVFLVAGALDASGRLSTERAWAISVVITMVLFVAIRLPESYDFFSVNGAFRLLPFFLLGYGLNRYRLFDVKSRSAALVLLAFAAVYIFKILIIMDLWAPGAPLERVVSLGVGVLGVVLIYSARKLLSWRWLAWIGTYSFGIYLLHVFGTAGVRIVLRKVGLVAVGPVFLASLVVGVAAPIVFQLIFARFAIVQRYVLGEKVRPIPG